MLRTAGPDTIRNKVLYQYIHDLSIGNSGKRKNNLYLLKTFESCN